MRNDGGAAFPIASDGDVLHGATFQDGRMTGGQWKAYSPGMSLRDYFAAAALPAILAFLPDALPSPIPKEIAGTRAAKAAYEAADAMLAERDGK